MSFADMEIEVSVDVLLKKLRSNREKHLAAYEKAKTGYLKVLRRELETKLKVLDGQPRSKVRAVTVNGVSEGRLDTIVNQKPQNFVASYDQVIGMLEFALDTTIKLDARQFEQYVKDQWNWTSTFTTSNVAYAAAAR